LEAWVENDLFEYVFELGTTQCLLHLLAVNGYVENRKRHAWRLLINENPVILNSHTFLKTMHLQAPGPRS